MARVLRRGTPQEDRGRGGTGASRLRRPRRPGRNLGPGRHHRLRSRHRGSAREGLCGRGHSHAGDAYGRPAGDPSQPLVPAGRPALPLHSARGGCALRCVAVGSLDGGEPRSCSSEARTRSTPTGSSSPWSTATSSRSASTPAGRFSRDRRCRSPAPSSTTTRAIWLISRCRAPGCSPIARSVCGGHSSSGWIAPARSSPRSGNRPTTRACTSAPPARRSLRCARTRRAPTRTCGSWTCNVRR